MSSTDEVAKNLQAEAEVSALSGSDEALTHLRQCRGRKKSGEEDDLLDVRLPPTTEVGPNDGTHFLNFQF